MPNPIPWSLVDRQKRRYAPTTEDQRNPFQRDRDRILYSSAFRRLAGITQIVRADEADVFHTRQQHSLKVAQVGRRLAEKCIQDDPSAAQLLGVDPEVVEAACLAHDLGHPPFGHVGEKVLHRLVAAEGVAEGYEGNAQTFRILTKLAVRFESDPGLDLTRATLAAVLKYPWQHEQGHVVRGKKWSVYSTESDDFNFARKFAHAHEQKSAEAELMDWADDIAYSVHDLEDFHRCAALPWRKILSEAGTEQLAVYAEDAWREKPADVKARLRGACRRLVGFLETFDEILEEPYVGSRSQRQQLRTMTSALIGRYIRAAKLKHPDNIGADLVCVEIAEDAADEVRILKQITRSFIIETPSLAAQQKGQERILVELFGDFFQDSASGCPKYLPVRLHYLWSGEGNRARFASDCIASLTEAEAVALHGRLRGYASGSVLDPIVR